MIVNILEADIKNRKYQQRHKEKPNGNFRTEIYNNWNIKIVTEYAQ